MHQAYLLVAHGSRDPRTQRALKTLAQSLDLEDAPVYTALLECHPQPLHEQILELASLLRSQNYQRLVVLPLFLGQGLHIQTDLPREWALAQAQLPPSLSLKILPTLGEHPRLRQLLERRLPSPESNVVRILLAHGSRYPGGNDSFLALAQSLGAEVAYWSISPTLEECLQALTPPPGSRIFIQPFFLFPGGLTDAIAVQRDALQAQYPWEFILGAPLAAPPLDPDFLSLIAQTLWLSLPPSAQSISSAPAPAIRDS
ncbi:MAG: sirohydrochlorin chelatase [Cyanobacteria bacterium RI_101]|nr:sirohydrochlorin chelatase [Cyanobacteria bacterium RI_101]